MATRQESSREGSPRTVTPVPPQLSSDLKGTLRGEGRTNSQVPRGEAPSGEDPAEALPRSSLGLHVPVTSNVTSPAPTTPPAILAMLAPHFVLHQAHSCSRPSPTMTLHCNRTICTCLQHPCALHPVLPALFPKHLSPPTSCAISSLPSSLQCLSVSTQCGLSESRDFPPFTDVPRASRPSWAPSRCSMNVCGVTDGS